MKIIKMVCDFYDHQEAKKYEAEYYQKGIHSIDAKYTYNELNKMVYRVTYQNFIV